jgi:hypothetical protein
MPMVLLILTGVLCFALGVLTTLWSIPVKRCPDCKTAWIVTKLRKEMDAIKKDEHGTDRL